jgi:hypothetical protein
MLQAREQQPRRRRSRCRLRTEAATHSPRADVSALSWNESSGFETPTLALSFRGADDEDPDDRLIAIPIAGFGVPLSRGALSSSRSPAALGLRGPDCWTRAARAAVDRYEVGTEQGSWRLFGTFSGWDLVAFTR